MTNRSQEVDRFMEGLDHPLKDGIERLRAAILDSNDRITEHIKWKAPSFRYADEDRVTFRLYPKDRAQLVFHRGAKVKMQPPEDHGPQHPLDGGEDRRPRPQREVDHRLGVPIFDWSNPWPDSSPPDIFRRSIAYSVRAAPTSPTHENPAVAKFSERPF
jgi:hypothetical protein